MKKNLLLTGISFCIFFTNLHAQVGIGIATPDASALVHVDGGISPSKGLLITGTYNFSTGTTPNLGAGSRLMFYPGKAAFRAGYVDAGQWDNSNIGTSSTATGYNTKASGYYSVAMGIGNQATGNYTTAFGRDNVASADYATVLGANNIATGQYSTAMGHNANVSGIGSFTIADNSIGTSNVNDNSMVMRFTGGYFLWSGTGFGGVYLAANQNSWSTFSDRRKKENFETINEEEILKKIDQFNLVTWNYKGQDAKSYRHYGPMAQDFYAAFGKDKYGVIGNDTTINQADFDGLNLVAIQALEKRTNLLKTENENLKQDDVALNKKLDQLDELKKENKSLRQSVAQLQFSVKQQQKLITRSLRQLEALTIKQNAQESVAIKQ